MSNNCHRQRRCFGADLYRVGGLIVNLNLARRGVIEFKILKTIEFTQISFLSANLR